MDKLSKVGTREGLRSSIKKSVDMLGGMESFVKKGEVVLLKPNFNTADPFPASTDPDFLREVARLVYEAGAKSVIVGESSTYFRNTRKEMEKLGIFSLEEEERPVKVFVFEERKWKRKEVPEGRYLKRVSLPGSLDDVDRLILLPCLKTHFCAEFTGALKLSVGFMNPKERIPLHARNLQPKIAELNKLIHPDLVIMDARKCFKNGGPSKGEVEEPGLILASPSRMATDIEGVKIIKGYKGNSLHETEPAEISHIGLSLRMGVGSEEYQIIED